MWLFMSHTEQFYNVTYISSFSILNLSMPFSNLVKSQRILDWSTFTLYLPNWAPNTCLPLYNTHLRPIQIIPRYSPAYGLSCCLELTTLFHLHIQATLAMDNMEEDKKMDQKQIIGEIIPSMWQVPFFGQGQLPLLVLSLLENHQE